MFGGRAFYLEPEDGERTKEEALRKVEAKLWRSSRRLPKIADVLRSLKSFGGHRLVPTSKGASS